MTNFRELDLVMLTAKGAGRELVEMMHLERQRWDVFHGSTGEVAIDTPS
jgi:hypothetical protein